MSGELTNQPSQEEPEFVRQVAAKAARKLRVQREGKQGVWCGLGMSGLIGWSVAVPTLLGAALAIGCAKSGPTEPSRAAEATTAPPGSSTTGAEGTPGEIQKNAEVRRAYLGGVAA